MARIESQGFGFGVSKGTPLPTDIGVGQNIRMFRLQSGLSQRALGKRIGITGQQILKYETGKNRVGASRLGQIAQVLGVPLWTLFDGCTAWASSASEASTRHMLAKPDSLRVVQAFTKIPSRRVRVAILELIDALGENAGTRPEQATF
jgi:transcriptional regulator with XRE-family HTH domain